LLVELDNEWRDWLIDWELVWEEWRIRCSGCTPAPFEYKSGLDGLEREEVIEYWLEYWVEYWLENWLGYWVEKEVELEYGRVWYRVLEEMDELEIDEEVDWEIGVESKIEWEEEEEDLIGSFSVMLSRIEFNVSSDGLDRSCVDVCGERETEDAWEASESSEWEYEEESGRLWLLEEMEVSWKLGTIWSTCVDRKGGELCPLLRRNSLEVEERRRLLRREVDVEDGRLFKFCRIWVEWSEGLSLRELLWLLLLELDEVEWG
jgi:hypothetical protein